MNVSNLFWAHFCLALVTFSGIKYHNLIRFSFVDLGLLVVNEHRWQLRRLLKLRREVMKLLSQIGYVRVTTEMCNCKGLSDWRWWLPKWNSTTSPVLAGFALTRNRLIMWQYENVRTMIYCMMFIINEVLGHHAGNCVWWLPVNEDGFITLPFHSSPY